MGDPLQRGIAERDEDDGVAAGQHAEILDQQFLTELDYISLDVEGGELAVLSDFPFDRFKVAAWTVENNTGGSEIPSLMREKGYKRVEALGVDDIYLLASDSE